MYSSVISLDVFFSLWIYTYVLWYDVLYYWLRTFIHLHIMITLAWPIIRDIQPISLGSEIWPRELSLRLWHIFLWSEPYLAHFPYFDIALTCIHPLWDLRSITLETIVWLSHPRFFLALHILSLIRPGRVWGVWAQGWSHMARVDLWSLGGLRCEDWSITWWDCHLFCREYRDWYCMMWVGLWWAVLLDEITVFFAWWVWLIHDSRGLTWLCHIDIDL